MVLTSSAMWKRRKSEGGRLIRRIVKVGANNRIVKKINTSIESCSEEKVMHRFKDKTKWEELTTFSRVICLGKRRGGGGGRGVSAMVGREETGLGALYTI